MSVRELPAPTRDVATATRELDEFGYALIAEALSDDQVGALVDRLFEQWRGETRARGDELQSDDETARGKVARVMNKGAVWRDVLDPSDSVHQLLDHAFTSCYDRDSAARGTLEQRYLLSASSATFKHRESLGPPGPLGYHVDQQWAAGHLDYPIVVTVFYLLTDFNDANGCTWVVPGSHTVPTPRPGRYHEDGAEQIADAVPVEAPAGTAFIFEGRTWHAAGINTSGELRAHLNCFHCAPYVRQREPYAMNLRQEVVDALSDEQKMLLGFDTGLFNNIEPTLGRANVSQTFESFGELHD